MDYFFRPVLPAVIWSIFGAVDQHNVVVAGTPELCRKMSGKP